MKSLIIIAHGSKKKSSNNEVIDIVNTIQQSDTKYDIVEPSFLEFAIPNLEKSIQVCIDKHAVDIDIYPYFLNSGKHVTVDIPNLIEEFKSKYPKISFVILPHFGQSTTIKDIILSDIH
jgi:sirohydrochlorin ferrochelatase